MPVEFREKQRCMVFTCKGAPAKEKPGHGPIAIRTDDPFVGRWEEALNKEKILCPNPRCPKAPAGEMRFFATRTGYMKAWCPTCGAVLSNSEPDRAKKVLYGPDNLSPGQRGVA